MSDITTDSNAGGVENNEDTVGAIPRRLLARETRAATRIIRRRKAGPVLSPPYCCHKGQRGMDSPTGEADPSSSTQQQAKLNLILVNANTLTGLGD